MNSAYALQVLYNLIAAPLLIMLVGLIAEPWRRRSMAAMMAVAAVVYIGGGLGFWEYPLALVLAACAVIEKTPTWATPPSTPPPSSTRPATWPPGETQHV